MGTKWLGGWGPASRGPKHIRVLKWGAVGDPGGGRPTVGRLVRPDEAEGPCCLDEVLARSGIGHSLDDQSGLRFLGATEELGTTVLTDDRRVLERRDRAGEIGRASCRERV